MHAYSVMFNRIGSGAGEGAEKVADLKPHLFEELSAENDVISPSHAIDSFSDIRALAQRSSCARPIGMFVWNASKPSCRIVKTTHQSGGRFGILRTRANAKMGQTSK